MSMATRVAATLNPRLDVAMVRGVRVASLRELAAKAKCAQ
jgi:hypothetical protein